MGSSGQADYTQDTIMKRGSGGNCDGSIMHNSMPPVLSTIYRPRPNACSPATLSAWEDIASRSSCSLE